MSDDNLFIVRFNIQLFIIIRGEPHSAALPFLRPAANGLYLVTFFRPRSDQGSEGGGQT